VHTSQVTADILGLRSIMQKLHRSLLLWTSSRIDDLTATSWELKAWNYSLKLWIRYVCKQMIMMF